jgi:hypothetical protein
MNYRGGERWKERIEETVRVRIEKKKLLSFVWGLSSGIGDGRPVEGEYWMGPGS